MLGPYRVLDLTDERGLLAGQMLADLGADVIVVEPPWGNSARRIGPFFHDEPGLDRSLYWWSVSRNKRSVTLNIETEDGRELFRRLVETADFIIESFEPGYLDNLGLGYEALNELNPRIIMVSITPFGQHGPKANWAMTDMTVLAASGTMITTGDEDRPPIRCVVPQAFLHASAEGAVGALLAHLARERDGVGQHVDVSAQTAVMMATQSMILQAGWGDIPIQRVAGGTTIGPVRVRLVRRCRDGYVSITFLFGNGLGPFSRRLMEWMYEEGFVDRATVDKDWIGYLTLLLSGEEPLSEFDRCNDVIDRFAMSHTKAELCDGASARSVLIAPVNDMSDLLASRQLEARNFWVKVPHPELGRDVVYAGPFVKTQNSPIRYRYRPPLIGEHNAEIFDTLGVDVEQQIALFAAGII